MNDHENQHIEDVFAEVQSLNITSYWDTLHGTTSYVEIEVNKVLGPAIRKVQVAFEKADQTSDGDVGHLWRWSEANDGWLWCLVHRYH